MTDTTSRPSPASGGPPAPDPLWNDLANLFGDRSIGGAAPELDAGSLARAHALLEAIAGRGAKPWNVLEAADIAKALVTRTYPIKGFAMAPGPPALWLSFSFGGKSVILQDMLLSLATGTRVWGQWSCAASKVLHIDYEQGRDETIDRYQRLARARRIDIATEAPGLRLVVMPPTYLNSAGAEDAYKRACDGHAVAFVDTFAASLPGVEENESAIGEHVYRLGRVSSATGCTVCVAHHMGKASMAGGGGGGRGGAPAKPPDPRTLARGSTAIVAAAGYVYALGGAKGEPKLVQQAKARGLGDPQVEDFYLELAAVDVRKPDLEHGWDGYFNKANPADVGGFSVTYKTLEQVVPPKPPKDESIEADIVAVLGYVRGENTQGRGVATMSAPVKALKMRKSDVLDAFKALINRRMVHGRGRAGASDFWVTNPLPLPDQ